MRKREGAAWVSPGSRLLRMLRIQYQPRLDGLLGSWWCWYMYVYIYIYLVVVAGYTVRTLLYLPNWSIGGFGRKRPLRERERHGKGPGGQGAEREGIKWERARWIKPLPKLIRHKGWTIAFDQDNIYLVYIYKYIPRDVVRRDASSRPAVGKRGAPKDVVKKRKK